MKWGGGMGDNRSGGGAEYFYGFEGGFEGG
jgi:hypothetical protein